MAEEIKLEAAQLGVPVRVSTVLPAAAASEAEAAGEKKGDGRAQGVVDVVTYCLLAPHIVEVGEVFVKAAA